jgi:predicted lipoprotein with Yx(FWY)xxD motif
MHKIPAGLALAATALLASACAGGGTATPGYDRAAGNAAQTPTTHPTIDATMTAAPTGTGSPGATPTGSPTATPMPTPEKAAIKTAESRYGRILTGEEGRTLYVIGKDDPSACTDTCAAWWPPAATRDRPKGGERVREDLLGTVTRGDGTNQVTYDKHPLYYYSGDTAKGDTLGQGREEFGGKWYVIGPDGKKVE